MHPETKKSLFASNSGSYQVEMAKLSLIVRELVSSGSLQGKAEGLVESILQKLRSWKRDVPAQLQWPAKDSSLDPLAATLNVGFHQVQILACLLRPSVISLSALYLLILSAS